MAAEEGCHGNMNLEDRLTSMASPGAMVSGVPADHADLAIPPGPAGNYRLAQFYDYRGMPRQDFPCRPPVRLQLQARAGAADIPGTWGFGFWNAPFSLGLGFGVRQVLPALPDAAWFFFASTHNYLSFRNDLPANGFMVQTFRSRRIPAWLLAPSVVGLPLLVWRPFARWVRHMASKVIDESGAAVEVDPTAWHDYAIDWQADRVDFMVDGRRVHRTEVSPGGPLGLVLWIDNQYAVFTPEGRIGYGTLTHNQEARLSIRGLQLET